MSRDHEYTVSDFGQRVKEWRLKNRLTQSGMAKGAGLRRTNLQNLEVGRVETGAVLTARLEKFMAEATEEIIASLRGPGVGNGQGRKRGPKRLRHSLAEERDLSPHELDMEFLDISKG